MADFTEWNVSEASQAISDAIEEVLGSRDAFDSNQSYAEKQDHWQEGETWVGPNGGSPDVWKSVVRDRVKRSFTPVGAIEEVLGRMANALLQQEADIDLIPLDLAEEGSDARARQEEEAAELKAALSAWWDEKKLWKLTRRAVRRSRWSGRGALRTWIAPGNLEEGQAAQEDGPPRSVTVLPSAADLAEALTMVELAAPEPDSTLVHTDEEDRREVAIFVYEDEKQKKAELWWVDDSGQTVLTIVGDEDDRADFRVDLQGRLPIAEMEAELLITEQVRKQQSQLDFMNTLVTRVGEAAGFPERYTTNAEPAGVWLETPPADDPLARTHEHDGKKYWLHRVPRNLGPMITTDLVGLINKTADGEQRATPGVVFKDPTDPEYAIKGKKAAYYSLLKEVHQGHLATESTAEASGEAYQQSRADYEDDLNTVKGDVEGLIRETLEAALAWAGAMSSEARGLLERYRVVVTLNVRSGPITPEEQRQNNSNVEAGTLSQESAMAANGVEDVDAELKKLRSQPDFVANLRKDQTLAILELVREGIGYELAGRWVGIQDEEELEVLREMDAQRVEPEEQEGAQDDEIEEILAGTAGGA